MFQFLPYLLLCGNGFAWWWHSDIFFAVKPLLFLSAAFLTKSCHILCNLMITRLITVTILINTDDRMK